MSTSPVWTSIPLYYQARQPCHSQSDMIRIPSFSLAPSIFQCYLLVCHLPHLYLQMTPTKIKNLKNQICGEFSEIFKLCQEVLEEAQKSSLIKATLETLLRFLNWIPLGYIFETTIIDLLLNRFLEAPDFRNVTLQCLAVIAALKVGVEYDPKFVILFQMVMTSINRMILPSTNISDAYNAYNAAGDAGQELVLNLSLFLSNFLSNHLRVVEGEATRDVLLNAHLYMVKVSQVDEREISEICLEY
ncbi:Importin N-terminal domain-containing protein [Mycena indigotica]|uniref:Importin N-terminal domain-containing protein n=1 Tax=Mycena indigotica TaxID=2126181 RepID=A0A8H6S673_9AGAR|nr:Importin N-terminal domain-containing protein [Mycena indigotica]KAF7293601.1 Importin N-terminal domain-containing protein [Mycena indigotica]